MTDGEPTVGLRNPAEIAARAASGRGERRVFTFGVGTDVNVSLIFFFSSRRRHTRFDCDWSSDVALPISRALPGGNRAAGNLPGRTSDLGTPRSERGALTESFWFLAGHRHLRGWNGYLAGAPSRQ